VPKAQQLVASSTAFLSTDVPVCGLPGGYFVTADIAGGVDFTLYLRTIADPDTAADSEYFGRPYIEPSTLTTYGAQNAAGVAFFVAQESSGVDDSFYVVTQSGGAMTLTERVLSAPVTASVGVLFVSNDGSQLINWDSPYVDAYAASTGTLDYSLDISAALGTLNFDVFGFPAADRIIIENYDTAEMQLLDETGTVLDTAAVTLSPGYQQNAGDSGTGLFITRMLSNSAITYNYLDATGDVLSWRYGANLTIADTWTGWSGSNLRARVSAYGEQVVVSVGPGGTPTYSPRSLYVVDTTTGSYVASTTQSDLERGANAVAACGPSASVAVHYSVSWSTWQSPTGPTYLRQRQSPVRAPSRVSWRAF